MVFLGSLSIDTPEGMAMPLLIGEAKTGTIVSSSWNFQYYRVDNTVEASSLAIRLDGFAKNVNLYVKKGSLPTKEEYDCRSTESGTAPEECVLDVSSSESVYVGVRGYAGDYRLLAVAEGQGCQPSTNTSSGLHSAAIAPSSVDSCYISPVDIGKKIHGWFGSNLKERRWFYYQVTNDEAGKKQLSIVLDGLGENIDLYVREGALPTEDDYDCRSRRGEAESEYCSAILTSQTPVYIGLQGTLGYFDLSVSEEHLVLQVDPQMSFHDYVSKGDYKLYRFEKVAGLDYLVCVYTDEDYNAAIYGSVDLYGNYQMEVSKLSHQYESRNPGNMDDCIEISSTQNGPYFLAVHGVEESSFKVYVVIHLWEPCSSCGYSGAYDRGWHGDNTNHLAQDYPAFVGDSVRAIADGQVHSVRYDVGGFGGSNPSRKGPAVVIRHKKKDGTIFFALYGHVYGMISEGDFVRANQIIGIVEDYQFGTKSWPHLHLGIWDAESNFPASALGYGADRSFVDPVPFLENTQYRSWTE